MPDTDLINKSVTKNDYADTPRGGVINFMIPWYPGVGVGLPPEPPQWWSRARDFTLRSTILYEDMWAAAIGIAITKIASSSWEVDSEIPLRARRGQDLINNSDWVKLFAKGLRDYLTTDNGQFVEIVRVAKSPVSSVVGLAHLDSLRCTRTGDPDIPVIYADRKGVEHEIRYENVIALSDLPDPGDTWFGVGNCAASRSYRSIYKLSVIERYVSEKVSGRRPLAIHFVSAVGQRQLDGIVQSAEENAARQGLLSYMGAIVVPLLDASVPPQVSTVPLAEFPDRFNRKEEFDIALYAYADNIGLDIQDLQPLTGQPLGTGAQSQVLDEKAKGKGLVIWKKDIAYELNQKVFDEQTTFAFIEKDYRDQERQAGVSNARATASKTRVDAGITTPAQELQVLVDLDELPNEFLPQDVTGETLSDEEKPDKEASAEETQAVEEMAMPSAQPVKETPPTEATAKETTQDDLDKLFTQELNEAIKLYQDTGGKIPETPGMKEAIKEVVLQWFKADDEDPGPFKTARQRKWFFAEGQGNASHGGSENSSLAKRRIKIRKLPEKSIDKRTPNGTPVSASLQNKTKGKTRESVDEAMAAIDSVHGDGNLRSIPVNQSAGTKTTGKFIYDPYTGESLEIKISTKSDTPMLDFTHEVGHFIQQEALGGQSRNDAVKAASKELTDAFTTSSAVKKLYAMYSDPITTEIKFDGFTEKWRPESSYVRYLLRTDEVFARSYSQYIATKSGNKNMVSELRKYQSNFNRVYNNQIGDGGGYPFLWTDEDFAPIATAYDNLFAAAGWTK